MLWINSSKPSRQELTIILSRFRFLTTLLRKFWSNRTWIKLMWVRSPMPLIPEVVLISVKSGKLWKVKSNQHQRIVLQLSFLWLMEMDLLLIKLILMLQISIPIILTLLALSCLLELVPTIKNARDSVYLQMVDKSRGLLWGKPSLCFNKLKWIRMLCHYSLTMCPNYSTNLLQLSKISKWSSKMRQIVRSKTLISTFKKLSRDKKKSSKVPI